METDRSGESGYHVLDHHVALENERLRSSGSVSVQELQVTL